MKLTKQYYIEYLLHTPLNYTCTNLSEHSSDLSHDKVNRFLRKEQFTSGQLWDLVKVHLCDSADSVIIADDSVQDKRYSKFIELVKNQYSGNEHGTVRGINLVNFVHSTGNDGDFFPIDYRIYHPESDGLTKNDHFQAMFMDLVEHKDLKTRTILFDSWYASVDNLKLIHRQNWVFVTTLKSNRLVSLDKSTGYQSLQSLTFEPQHWTAGVVVKLKELPFKVKLFKLVSTNGDIEWVITNDLSVGMNAFVVELKNDNRWQVEEFHRGFKQLTGAEKCQCRKATAQRNHLACCYLAWVSLKLQALKMGKTIYQVRQNIFAQFLKNVLQNPICPVLG
jgi:hypothetical protein